MLFTKESDYAICVVRALKDGEKLNIRQVCTKEGIPEAFAYKIMQKLSKAGIVSIIRGAGGGYLLSRPIQELTLYDVVTAIEADFAVMECIHHFCSRNSGDRKCKVHRELLQIQKGVELMLQEKTLYEILQDE